MTIAPTGVNGWASEVQSAMTSLPAELEQAAPTGGFARVLAEAAVALQGRSQGASTAGPSSGTVATLARAPAATPAGPTGASWSVGGAGQQVVADASRYLGTPYVWGGESPSGFDCSGLVQYVYRQVGVTLPRTTYTQVKVGTPVASLAQAQPGDLVFFAGSDGTNTSPGHVGIYIGHGQMIDAPYTGASVRVDPVGHPVAIRRVLPSTAAASARAVVPSGGAAALSGSIGTSVPSNLAPLFVSAAAKYGVPVRLLTAVAYHESRYQPHAVSSAGAEGIMQIMPGTAAGLGVTPFTPAQAIDGAARLLSGYLQQFGSVPLALAAYNAGAGAVQAYGGIPPYAETQAYVKTVMQKLGGVA